MLAAPVKLVTAAGTVDVALTGETEVEARLEVKTLSVVLWEAGLEVVMAAGTELVVTGATGTTLLLDHGSHSVTLEVVTGATGMLELLDHSSQP